MDKVEAPYAELAREEGYLESLLTFIREGLRGGRIVISGLPARAYLAARIFAETEKTILLIVPTEEEAGAAADSIRFFLKKSGDAGAAPREKPCVFLLCLPQPEPFYRSAPDVSKEGERLAALAALSGNLGPAVVVASAPALMLKAPPAKRLIEAIRSVATGDEISREETEKSLFELGYKRVIMVEEPGEASIRGNVVDIFPPGQPDPVRLEFFGDKIESIRTFDPQTQRSRTKIDRTIILPARAIDLSPESRAAAAGRIRELAIETDYPMDRMREIADAVKEGAITPDLYPLFPLFFDRMDEPLRHLRAGALVLSCDEEEMEAEADEFEKLIRRKYDDWIRSGGLHLSPEAAYAGGDELMQGLRQLERFRLEKLEKEGQGGDGGPVFPIKTCENSDIRLKIEAARTDSGSDGVLTPLAEDIRRWRDSGAFVAFVCRTRSEQERLAGIISEYGFETALLSGPADLPDGVARRGRLPYIPIFLGELSAGFRLPDDGIVFLTEEEIFGPKVRRPRRARRGAQLASADIAELKSGEFVVHETHGIGRYIGLERIAVEGVEYDFIHLEYSGRDKLYIPVDKINSVQKYIGQEGYTPRLDRLGGTSWEKTKRRVAQSVRKIAEELLKLYAARQVVKGHAFSPPDKLLREFEAGFTYEETPDQMRAIEDVYADMEEPRPMDRLVCGDVGYGKTEVAMRAAFVVVTEGKQVAVLVPTTVLAEQHLATFRERFRGYPVKIEALSRFRTKREQKEIVRRLEAGDIDIIIGTHRLLGKDVKFRELGLLVVDEEHRFGVAHKEKIKQMKTRVDVLTLTATPIPRTLNMSLMGIRDLSIIETPPEERLAIRTRIVQFDKGVIREAIVRELERGGQVFFVHNRVQSIHKMAALVERLVPEARIAIAHGQLRERELEEVMLRFLRKEVDVLVTTNIIESGLDIPSANTIIINRADRFGLADIYQLRGRVGRSNRQAYAYLLLPAKGGITEEAYKRLKAIQDFSDLSSGFKIAMRDLEIRGAGEILGKSQSGHIAAVGYEMFVKLLDRAVREMRGEKIEEEVEPEISIAITALLPDTYIPDTGQRLSLYKRFASAGSEEEIEAIREEMIDIYGFPPEEAANLVELMRIKALMKKLKIQRLEMTGRGEFFITFHPQTMVEPRRIVELVESDRDSFRWASDLTLAYKPRGDAKEAFGHIKKVLMKMA